MSLLAFLISNTKKINWIHYWYPVIVINCQISKITFEINAITLRLIFIFALQNLSLPNMIKRIY